VIALTASTSSTNSADDFAHRGDALRDMPYYLYRMYVRREPRGHRKARPGCKIFEFDEHYPLFRAYLQRVRLDRMDVPTIDGFQCPTWGEDPEQNSVFKAMLFTPWACHSALACGQPSMFAHMLCNGNCCAVPAGFAPSTAPNVAQFTFERAWRRRCAEIHVLAQRAEGRRDAARKELTLADTTLFSKYALPIDAEKATLQLARSHWAVSSAWCKMWRGMPAQALRLYFACRKGCMSPWHGEQCTLGEYCAYVARDILCHIDLAAEARVKPSVKKPTADVVDEDDDSDDDAAKKRRVATLEFEDIGGVAPDDDEDGEAEVTEVSAHPVRDHHDALALVFQREHFDKLRLKTRLSTDDKTNFGSRSRLWSYGSEAPFA